MGLAISTGYLADMLVNDAEGAEWFKKNLALVNELLAANGLPAHDEPEEQGPVQTREHCGSFPYSFLHYLRRAFARVREGQAVTPVLPDEEPADDPAIDSVGAAFDAHLLCHSDAEGFYVPIDFNNVIFDVGDRGLPGGMLGSTQRLMAELLEVAPALGINVTGGRLSDAEAAQLAAENDEAAPLWHERLVWLALYENARVSIANRCLLVFC